MPNSLQIRQNLSHPVIDSDGHLIEHIPTFLHYLKEVGGTSIQKQFKRAFTDSAWYAASPQQRFEEALFRPSWWSFPAKNSLDRATGMFPALLRDRMDELGLDFSIVYSSMGIFLPRIEDTEVRTASCRALNTMLRDIFSEFSHRMTPVAVIPMHTPNEAIDELSHSVSQLGLKAVHVHSRILRPIQPLEENGRNPNRSASWYDHIALGSAYDYDPVWQKCVELKVAPGTHSDGSWGSRVTSNFVNNHIGNFAAAGESFCKALVLGGVTRRFPALNFSFLEGGVAWASDLYNGLVSRAEKRNKNAIHNYNPKNIDHKLMDELCSKYGKQITHIGDRKIPFDPLAVSNAAPMAGYDDSAESIDDFEACGVTKPEDLRPLFEDNFYFGCEADDKLVALAFDKRLNPFGARLKAMFSSDNGHWDVLDMSETLVEAYELVEDGLLTEEDFRDFTFVNPVNLYTRSNPTFFDNTALEDHVNRIDDSELEFHQNVREA